MVSRSRNPLIFLLLLSVGIVIGGLIGDMFKESIPILGYSKSIGFQPFTLDLIVLKATFGLMISLNLASIIGIIISIFIFSRL